jgi:hypothetical protein
VRFAGALLSNSLRLGPVDRPFSCGYGLLRAQVPTDFGGIWSNRLVEEIDSLDKRLREQATTRATVLMDAGVTPDEATEQAIEELVDGFKQRSETVADGLESVTREHLPDRFEYEAGFRQRLSEAYGEAFEAYDTVVQVVAGAARDFWHRYKEEQEPDELTEVLWANLAQCLRVAREIGHLLRGGFPYGALAAQRTAYELSVRSTVLQTHAREPGHEDLVERYRLHDHIGREADIREYQRSAEALGFTPYEDSKVQAVDEQRKNLLKRFGKQFGTQYGWAVGLPGVTAGNFREIEELAGIDHRRGFYRWASHYLHGDPSSLRMSIMRRGGVSQGVVSDLTNIHLTDPAQFTLYALQLTYISIVVDAPPLADLFIARGLPHLTSRAGDAFWAAEQAIMDAEEKLQQELATEQVAGTSSDEAN